MLLFRVKLIRYDEDGKLFVMTPASNDGESPVIDASFSKHTAGSITRQRASFACHMLSDELDTILLRAHELALYEDEEEEKDISSGQNFNFYDDSVVNSDDE